MRGSNVSWTTLRKPCLPSRSGWWKSSIRNRHRPTLANNIVTPETKKKTRMPGRKPTRSSRKPPSTGIVIEKTAKRVWMAANAVALLSGSTESANMACLAGRTMLVKASKTTPGTRCSHLVAKK